MVPFDSTDKTVGHKRFGLKTEAMSFGEFVLYFTSLLAHLRTM